MKEVAKAGWKKGTAAAAVAVVKKGCRLASLSLL
jgi:hypothetical protein